jgi:hypothetical protein
MRQPQIGNNVMNKKGVSIVEALVSLAVISVALLGVLALSSFSLATSTITQQRIQAGVLAQESIEILRNYRDGIPWNDDDPADEYDGLGIVSTGNPYHFEQSAGLPPFRWRLLAGQETIGIFTRKIEFSDVLRDANDDISATGILDPDTKLAVATVSWSERGRNHEIRLEAYVTNWNQ